MASLKSLLKDTAIYGISSIVGRFLNYMLVPIYTHAMSAAQGGYGVITEVYAWVALLLVILTYGMETTFFRFINKETENPRRIYSTVLIMVGSTSVAFLALSLAFLGPIADWMGYGGNPWYIGMMFTVVAMDAFQSIPFAYLRYKRRAWHFAGLKLLFIVLNIIANIVYYVVLGGSDVVYAFIINLGCTSVIMLMLLPVLDFGGGFDRTACRSMLRYTYPLLILGIAGILNQVADKILFCHIYRGTPAEAKTQLAIYGAASKIAMIMAMLTQAFRYAYEPFVFAGSADRNSRPMLAKAMKYFIVFTLLAFLAVEFYIDILKYLINSDNWEGLRVVPIVMAAEIFMGIYFNLSFWYKLIDDTKWGAIFSFAGCAVLIAVNVVFVPVFGYTACAWAGFAGYGVAMVLSYVVGQRRNPIDYDLRSIAFYFVVAGALFAADRFIPYPSMAVSLPVRTVMLLAFVAVIMHKEGINPRKFLRR
ncbi:MAG: polysaccharide biosynthesis C-terminal domain-containing protein [Candidatus Limisoma sp.]|nr:polysaccharide biosynthesis C-terminal domain-containing protein [Candidatus Limisoma sp.]